MTQRPLSEGLTSVRLGIHRGGVGLRSLECTLRHKIKLDSDYSLAVLVGPKHRTSSARTETHLPAVSYVSSCWQSPRRCAHGDGTPVKVKARVRRVRGKDKSPQCTFCTLGRLLLFDRHAMAHELRDGMGLALGPTRVKERCRKVKGNSVQKVKEPLSKKGLRGARPDGALPASPGLLRRVRLRCGLRNDFPGLGYTAIMRNPITCCHAMDGARPNRPEG